MKPPSRPIPRPEYPRPQFERKTWFNLNGTWTIQFDHEKSGRARDLSKATGFAQNIEVPFCVESRLSGLAHTDFVECLWYHRSLTIPEIWMGQKIFLHFGGVDDEAVVFLDGVFVARHVGGSSPFSVDLTPHVTWGTTHQLVVEVKDELRKGNRMGGKQSIPYQSSGCHYTRTTGIWQTVWVEAVPPQGLKEIQLVPDFDGGRFLVTPSFYSQKRGHTLTARLLDGEHEIAQATVPATNGSTLVIEVPSAKPWSPEHPFLYQMEYEVKDEGGTLVDQVSSYGGLRKMHIEGNRLFLNNEPLFQRLVLDQGFYPEGIWTAPTDDDLRRDILLAQKAGFNGARLHQKAFEERFHYWADKLGYLTWAESPSWGLDLRNPLSFRNFVDTWHALVVRDRNHPSIITWSPFNESIPNGDFPKADALAEHQRAVGEVSRLTRSLDRTRPVNDASGYVHADTDLWTVHNYEQDPAKQKDELTPKNGKMWTNRPDLEMPYQGQPYLVDEFGGILWVPGSEKPFAKNTWGYGRPPESLEEFYSRLEAQVKNLIELPHIEGYCYTQLTDVEQEQNGIYTYDRREKFDMKHIASIFIKTPGR